MMKPERGPMQRFADKVVMVTGGGMGIGEASARAFASEGAHVYVADIDVAAGEATAASIRAGGGSAEFVEMDVAREDQVRAGIEKAVADRGRLDVMHANAGIELTRSVIDTTLEQWQRVVDINLTGIYLASRHALIQMREQQGGSVVVTVSPHAFVSGRGMGAYAAAKGGDMALVRVMALEAAEFNVRVNGVLPGGIDTPMLHREAQETPDPELQLQRFGEIHALNRLGEAQEVAKCVLFLASDDASFVTGTALACDGGLMAAQPSGAPMKLGLEDALA
jgi:NAD(P)-dependent dehydrogenase (short-subunit alcohol dehydrogenase family)